MSPLGSVTTAARTELGVEHLRAVWQRALANTRGDVPHDPGAAHLDRLTTDALGLGLEQVTQHLLQTQPDFDAFERWIVETRAALSRSKCCASTLPCKAARHRLPHRRAWRPSKPWRRC